MYNSSDMIIFTDSSRQDTVLTGPSVTRSQETREPQNFMIGMLIRTRLPAHAVLMVATCAHSVCLLFSLGRSSGRLFRRRPSRCIRCESCIGMCTRIHGLGLLGARQASFVAAISGRRAAATYHERPERLIFRLAGGAIPARASLASDTTTTDLSPSCRIHVEHSPQQRSPMYPHQQLTGSSTWIMFRPDCPIDDPQAC